MGTYGIDISNVNGPILDLAKLNPGFVIAKASEGTGFIDSTYKNYREQAAALKKPFGAYHFFHAESLTARAQSRLFCNIAQPVSGMSLWLDYESYGASGQADAEEIGYFMAEAKEWYPQAKIGFYCNSVGLGRILPYLSEIHYDQFWYANPSIPVNTQDPNLAWQIHQYGITNGIDQNYWSLSIPQIEAHYAWA
jgi:GH25 family lysozyme M1 (1,4-beta-N-acetylmuramidase)